MGIPVFTGQGDFSHINVQLRAALTEELGPMRWYDARAALDAPFGVALGALAAATRRPEFILQPRRLNHARVKTTPTFDLMSYAAARFARNVEAPYIFQTQGLFNAHIDGRPLFVYTDYTERANLRSNVRHRLMPSRWLRRELNLYDNAELIFAASSTTRESLIFDYGITPEKVILTHTGVNVQPPPSVPERSHSALNILFVGRDWERKGGPDLLQAFQRVRGRIPSATLTVVGCTPGGHPPPGVRYVGQVTPQDLPRYFAAASLFCLPAFHEPAGIAYSDASAWGLPVVATTAGDIGDRVLDGRTGFLVSPGDVDALGDALLRVALDRSLRRALGRAGREHTLANFTWSRVAAKIAAAMRPRLGLTERRPERPLQSAATG